MCSSSLTTLLSDTHELELRFHPEQEEAQRVGDTFFLRGEKANMIFDPLTVEDVEIVAEKHDLISRRYQKSEMFAIRMKSTRSQWRNAVALSWADINEKPVEVSLRKQKDIWTFTAGDRRIMLNWKTGTAEMVR